MIILANVLRLHIFKELTRVVTGTHYLNVLEIMSKINWFEETKIVFEIEELFSGSGEWERDDLLNAITEIIDKYDYE